MIDVKTVENGEAEEVRLPNRRERRDMLFMRRTREDGSPFTKPALGRRRRGRRAARKAGRR